MTAIAESCSDVYLECPTRVWDTFSNQLISFHSLVLCGTDPNAFSSDDCATTTETISRPAKLVMGLGSGSDGWAVAARALRRGRVVMRLRGA